MSEAIMFGGLGVVGRTGRPAKQMTKYLFIDGGFIEKMIPKTEAYFGIDLSSEVFDYRVIVGGFQRTFYYDALPEKKPTEDDAVFEGKRNARIKLFDRVNRTPFMHTREGVTRNRSSRKTLEQKGIDILLAIDVFKHATLRNMSEAHVMTCDLDFFPLFEALRDTPVSVHLHCYVDETSPELMSLADVVIPITPFTILRWLQHKDRENYVEWNISWNDLNPTTLFKEGTYEGLPFHIFKEPNLNERPYLARGMAHNPLSLMRAERWDFIVHDFEARLQKRIYFDT